MNDKNELIKIEESRVMEDYKQLIIIAVDYYWKAMERGYPYAMDLPLRKGTTIFRYKNREYDFKDYQQLVKENK
jgi:hypothetical protein